jgi:hypothetical protein
MSPLNLLEPWLFPNVDTLHFTWLENVQINRYSSTVQFKRPINDRCWPTIRHLSLQMRTIDLDDEELTEHDDSHEIRLLFPHFIFPELRTFSLELTMPWIYMHWQCEAIAEHIQGRNWAKLESGDLIIHVPLDTMEIWIDDPEIVGENPMLEEEAVWVS